MPVTMSTSTKCTASVSFEDFHLILPLPATEVITLPIVRFFPSCVKNSANLFSSEGLTSKLARATACISLRFTNSVGESCTHPTSEITAPSASQANGFFMFSSPAGPFSLERAPLFQPFASNLWKRLNVPRAMVTCLSATSSATRGSAAMHRLP